MLIFGLFALPIGLASVIWGAKSLQTRSAAFVKNFTYNPNVQKGYYRPPSMGFGPPALLIGIGLILFFAGGIVLVIRVGS